MKDLEIVARALRVAAKTLETGGFTERTVALGLLRAANAIDDLEKAENRNAIH